MKISPREYDTIIAALRRHQWAIQGRYDFEGILDSIASEHGDPLTPREIDTLVNKIQFDEV